MPLEDGDGGAVRVESVMNEKFSGVVF